MIFILIAVMIAKFSNETEEDSNNTIIIGAFSIGNSIYFIYYLNNKQIMVVLFWEAYLSRNICFVSWSPVSKVKVSQRFM